MSETDVLGLSYTIAVIISIIVLIVFFVMAYRLKLLIKNSNYLIQLNQLRLNKIYENPVRKGVCMNCGMTVYAPNSKDSSCPECNKPVSGINEKGADE